MTWLPSGHVSRDRPARRRDLHGRVQAAGAVSEKIKGFFDVCRRQGVLMPAANVDQLMLREAAAQGRFHVHAVGDVGQAIELTGVPAGEPECKGGVPEGLANRLIALKLAHMSELRRALAASVPARRRRCREGIPRRSVPPSDPLPRSPVEQAQFRCAAAGSFALIKTDECGPSCAKFLHEAVAYYADLGVRIAW